MRQIAVAMLLWAALIGRPAVHDARASGVCTVSCLGDARACVQAGSVTKLACLADCKGATGQPGPCFRDCRAAFRAERTSCRTVGRTCAADCTPDDSNDGEEPSSPPNPACPGRCGMALGKCLHGASGGMPACLHQCDKGRERHACVQECLVTAKDGGSQCHAQHDECIAACGGTSTSTTTTTFTTFTTFTSTTTFTTTSTTPPLCGDAAAPTCDGACPDTTMVCVEIEPGVCGCTGGSAGLAFVPPHPGRGHH